MTTTIPKNWGNKTAFDFAKWMEKIKSIHYSNDKEMENAYLKFEK